MNRNEVFVPQTEGKYKYRKLCRECFFRVLNSSFNGNGEIKGMKK